MENLLSAGALKKIIDGEKPAYPVFQIIGYKPMTSDQQGCGESAEGELRYRLMVGDGTTTHQYCIITNQDLVQDIQNGLLEKWSIVRLNSYQTVDCDQKRTLIYILNLEVIRKGSEVGKKLNVELGNQPPQQFQAPQPQQPLHQQIQQQTNQRNFSSPTQPKPYPMNNNTPTRPMRSGIENQCIGIGELTPYIGKWVVKGRVTSKSGIREYTNAKGAGKLFNFSLADKTGEIKITAFNADCERVFSYVEPNKIYMLGRASVKNADKRYTTADFEITLNSDSLLEEVTDSDTAKDIPLAKFNFVSIASLTTVQPEQRVDLIGAITSISDVSTIISRTKNKELKKREIVIVDMSRHTVNVTLWGDQAESFVGLTGDVFITKGARISQYGGRSASAGDCILVNPDIPETRKVKNWYSHLIDDKFTNLTSSQGSSASGDQWKNIAQANDLDQAKQIISSGNQSSLYCKSKAMLMSVGRNPVYKCCPIEGCGKKLTETQNNEHKCEKCQQTYTNFKYRYKTDVEIEDHTSSAWVTLWDEKAEALFGMKPEELERAMQGDKDVYEKLITKQAFKKFIFTLRCRVDSYQNQERVKLQVVNISPVDPVTYTKRVLDEIRQMLTV